MGLLVPAKQPDRSIQVADRGDLVAKCFARTAAMDTTAGPHRCEIDVSGDQNRGNATVLCNVDDLLLRHPAHDTKAMMGGREAHDCIERFLHDFLARVERWKVEYWDRHGAL